MGRKRDIPIRMIAATMNDIFGTGRAVSGTDMKREALQAIMIKAAQMWRRANRPKQVSSVQPLACFNSGDLSIGAGGELRGPNDSFNCVKSERCAAARWMYDDGAALTKLIDALHPNNLNEVARTKRENSQRRKALKELKQKGARDFDKRRCRALGDSYFAEMCPRDASIATTNLSDFEPLCKALGKTLKSP